MSTCNCLTLPGVVRCYAAISSDDPDFCAAMRATAARAGSPETHWCRTAMYEASKALFAWLHPDTLTVLEVSGTTWRGAPFGSYHHTTFADYDVCAGPPDGKYDLIILDQVLEHVRYPQLALKNVRQGLTARGRAFISTPFLIRVHKEPVDLWRWTEDGLRCLLEDAGFTNIATGSWGNRACVAANLDHWKPFDPATDSLVNEPDVPVTVWALAG